MAIKSSMSFNLVLIVSLLAISMVESRTLSDVPGKKQSTLAGDVATSTTEVDESVVVTDSTLSGVVPNDLIDVTNTNEAIPDLLSTVPESTDAPGTKSTTSAKQIIMTDAKLLMTNDDSKLTFYNENIVTVAKLAQMRGPGGTATVETEPTTKSVSNSMMTASTSEPVTNYTQSVEQKEILKTDAESTKTVESLYPAIGKKMFFGKLMSGSEKFNMTTKEYYDKIYPTNNCDFFLMGRILTLADTPHNRMVLDKFAGRKSDVDDSTDKKMQEETTNSTTTAEEA